MKKAGHSATYVFGLWTGIALISGLSRNHQGAHNLLIQLDSTEITTIASLMP
jgi:hypothetical protein